jgi:predicted GH43/DUF377 family glycosyl hydrolase
MRMTEVGFESLRWLVAEQYRGHDVIFVPIGSRGFAVAGGINARFDPDLRHWGSHKVMLEARRGGWRDANKIGLFSTPINTEKGCW